MYVGKSMQFDSSLCTQYCVLVCVYSVLNVLLILCDPGELFLHTNTETQSKTSFYSSLFDDSFTTSVIQQLDKNTLHLIAYG